METTVRLHDSLYAIVSPREVPFSRGVGLLAQGATTSGGVRVELRDVELARQLFRRIVRREGASHRLRELLAVRLSRPTVMLMTEDELIDQLARRVARSELHVYRAPLRTHEMIERETVEEVALGPAPEVEEIDLILGWVDGVEEPPVLLGWAEPEEEPPALVGYVDAPPEEPAEYDEQQVATLKAAADEGAPFCEECAKASAELEAEQEDEEEAHEEDEAAAAIDAKAQAGALKSAADDGVPFCEECAAAEREMAAEG